MQKFIPESKQDTLMACFCLFLFGKETNLQKRQMRKRLMDRFAKLIEREDCYTFASIQAFVNRLHSIHPNQIPRQAEQLFLRDQGRLVREGMTFLAQNRRNGFVGDKFTFCYLFAEVFSVDVHLYQPEEVALSVTPFAKYHMHLCHQKDHRFHLLFQAQEMSACPFQVPRGVYKSRPKIRMPKYFLNKKPMIPPAVKEYRVHHLCIYQSANLYTIESAEWPTDRYAYIYAQYEPHGKLDLLSCASKKGQTGAWFRLKSVPCAVYVVVGEEPEQSIHIESRFVVF